MNISWHGLSCFEISTSQNKNHQVNIVIDPFDENLGLRLPKLEADILLITDLNQKNNTKAVTGDPFIINGPGEYEIKDVYIEGAPVLDEKNLTTIYTIEAEDLRICHLGNFKKSELSPDQVDKLGEIDILMVPIGGSISAKEAIKIMSQIEPHITIPMQYHLPKLKVKLDGLDKFLKALGIKKIETLPKLSIKKKNILPDEAKIIALEP